MARIDVEVDIEIDEYLDEVDTEDLIEELMDRMKSSNTDRSIISKFINTGIKMDNLDEEMKQELWTEISGQKTWSQWREFFNNNL